jgi:hypothetical protein
MNDQAWKLMGVDPSQIESDPRTYADKIDANIKMLFDHVAACERRIVKLEGKGGESGSS